MQDRLIGADSIDALKDGAVVGTSSQSLATRHSTQRPGTFSLCAAQMSVGAEHCDAFRQKPGARSAHNVVDVLQN